MINIKGEIISLTIDGIEYIKEGVDMTDKERIKNEIERCRIAIKDLESRSMNLRTEKATLETRLKEIEEIEEKPCDDVDGNPARYHYHSANGFCVLSGRSDGLLICCGPYRPTKQEAREVWDKMMQGAKQ